MRKRGGYARPRAAPPRHPYLPQVTSNPIVDRLPERLRRFVRPQDYDHYTPVDQAVWRYVLRRNRAFFPAVAHESYLDGLRRTGITTERIPDLYGMNRILKDIGWAAVAVDGFIPPNAFMEFQAYQVLVVAADIRQLHHILYTPAPDILHEAAGHAPIIADPAYAEYLRRLGAIGARAITSAHDDAVFEAVRHLSDLKELRGADPADVAAAQARVDELQAAEVEPSEMARIRNLQWWTVEYGLIGTPDAPKIYGAGLLSSIGESASCLGADVPKLPYTVAAAERSFDITRPQPQLYVTSSFSHLAQVLEEFADTLALRRGGELGLRRLCDSRRVGTVELDTGLEVSGVFAEYLADDRGRVTFVRTAGPTALAYRGAELIGHGTATHAAGFSSPLGRLRGVNLPLEEMSPTDLRAYGIVEGEWADLTFASGIEVGGRVVTGVRNLAGKIMLVTFAECTVRHGATVLFEPSWGTFDMAVGGRVVSAYAGPADEASFPGLYGAPPPRAKPAAAAGPTPAREGHYRAVREMRLAGEVDEARLRAAFAHVRAEAPADWLLPLEIVELTRDPGLERELRAYLAELSAADADVAGLVGAGLERLAEEAAYA